MDHRDGTTHHTEGLLAAAEMLGADQAAVAECDRPKRGFLRKVGIGLLAVLAVLAVLGVLLYNFGGISGSVYDPGIKQQYAQLVASGQAPKVDQRFTIPIPGCKCHSTDPVLTEQHRSRHIRDCSSCHSR